MDVNPVTAPRSSGHGQSSADARRSSGDSKPAAVVEPARRLETSQAANSNVSGNPKTVADIKPADTEDLQKAETLRALISNKNMELKTYHDEASGRSVLEVSNQATGEVVSQYPSDELLRIYAALREPLIDKSA